MTLEQIDLENYRLDLLRKDSGTLVVTFKAMAPAERENHLVRDRPGWLANFLEARDESILHVKPTASNWYRRPDFHAWLDQNQALFSGFDRVVLIGGSMGGYGALDFAEVMQATQVLSMNPQSTLAKDLVPWETRFPLGDKEDWSGAYRDAALTGRGEVHVIADRYDLKDYAHVQRLKNIHFSNFPFVGHMVPVWLTQLQCLHPIVGAVIDAQPPDAVKKIVSQSVRDRRKLARWWGCMLDAANKHKKLHFVEPFLTEELVDGLIPKNLNDSHVKRVRHAVRKMAQRSDR
jgi:hypothetical protein